MNLVLYHKDCQCIKHRIRIFFEKKQTLSLIAYLKVIFLSHFICLQSFAIETNQQIIEKYGIVAEKFTLHQPTYFIIGSEDAKMQFSFKYRLSLDAQLYLAYSQLMFWSIYEDSSPFYDVNFNPEIFYRLIDKEQNALATLDLGHMHLSNGQKEKFSRSLDRLYLRTNYVTKLRRHKLNFSLMIFHLFNEDDTNKDIVNHLGYWDLRVLFSNLLMFEKSEIGFELRTYAGSKLYDLDQGALQLGLIWSFKSESFNPAIYLQFFEGYSESLMGYDKSRTEYRLGLNLTF